MAIGIVYSIPQEQQSPDWEAWERERDAAAAPSRAPEASSTLRKERKKAEEQAARIPADIAAMLTDEQKARLAAAIEAARERPRPSYARQERWGARYLRTISARIRTEEALAFKRLCDTEGLTRHVAIGSYVRACLMAGRLLVDEYPL